MPSSCKDLRAALADCLQNSDCVMVQRNSAADCLRPPLIDTLPTRCQQLKKGYGECKRGMVDMRKRFRGNMPVALAKDAGVEDSVDTNENRGQLYAGRPLSDVVRASAGGRDDTQAGSECYQDVEPTVAAAPAPANTSSPFPQDTQQSPQSQPQAPSAPQPSEKKSSWWPW
ncbi:cytochrome c oxidase assembly protein PET191-domain-containing protein [Phyllosticta citrichinensis]|uniref:Cytochrome c oxidase assembly protein PET191-domain-containing protein n=1 Tax=Phyllosticta citrichinensis TaxID=1130410 RepID=A0ABR1Y538_9PEZI